MEQRQRLGKIRDLEAEMVEPLASPIDKPAHGVVWPYPLYQFQATSPKLEDGHFHPFVWKSFNLAVADPEERLKQSRRGFDVFYGDSNMLNPMDHVKARV